MSGNPEKLSAAEIERIKRAYPDPDGDADPEPYEWADGILGEWANGAVQPIHAHGGDIKAAAYSDLDRMYGEWARRGEAIQKLLSHIDALQAENERLRAASAELLSRLAAYDEWMRTLNGSPWKASANDCAALSRNLPGER